MPTDPRRTARPPCIGPPGTTSSKSLGCWVAAGARPDWSNRYGVRPLSLACTNGSTAMVELLLEAGANPNTTLPGGETALMTAARTGRLGPVKALLRGGASPRATVRGMGRQDGAGANAFLRRMRDPSVFDFRPNSDQTA